MQLADAGGLEELTMRSLARELRVEAMSLYHHVPSKDAILDGMVDLVFAEIELPRLDLPWREAIRRRMVSMREVLLRHRWALRVIESRAQPGMTTLKHHDAMIGCLRAAGFSIALTAHAYAVLDAFVFGLVHTELSLPFQNGPETQEVAAAIFAQMPAGLFPHLAELTREHVLQPGYAYGDELGFGLELILDGLERAREIERASATAL
ncbi:MAG: TetR/AcrR family transcriptional regulator C-terminal domain-containing protein [Sandaracinus sp.]